jgi:hypothetical protein
MRKVKVQPRAEAMGLPKGVKLRRFFGFYFLRRKDFRKIVAKSCYDLTHEFTASTLYASSQDSRFTGHTDAALLELDKQMKLFTNSVLAEE